MLLMFSCIGDSSVAPLLDMRRRFKAVVDVLGAMIRSGISLSRDQWSWLFSGIGFLLLGRCILLLWMIFLLIGVWTLVHFFHAASDVHRRLGDFIHQVVVHCRDEAIREWRRWIREDPLVHPYRWLRPDLVPPAPFLQCKRRLTPGGSGVLSDPARIDEEFRKAWLP